MIKVIIKIEKYVYSTICRRKMILEHFGELTDYEKCNNCDNCYKDCKVIKRYGKTFVINKKNPRLKARQG